ncbi:uncharacterized protein DUF2550 [Haloactinospora alba]|uniref:Uncharacterized protein DUF2550 n=1 Tax=Haloactinospora alba TaxID=405555 RepID=A0A543NL81_9ACTN|nr:DUF2550 domain-containing protein [Haloactinospora alba]TQN32603.1 uncharacterized protein DUF2550 [Haloactinospora alba]
MGALLTGQPWYEIAEWLVLALLALALLGLVAVTLRRMVLEHGGGAVECYVREPSPRSPWRIGFGRYGADELRWYRIFSLWPRPTVELSRRGLTVLGRRSPTSRDLAELTSDVTVLEVGWSVEGTPPTEASLEIAMSEGALTGFLSWLESRPPGSSWH